MVLQAPVQCGLPAPPPPAPVLFAPAAAAPASPPAVNTAEPPQPTAQSPPRANRVSARPRIGERWTSIGGSGGESTFASRVPGGELPKVVFRARTAERRLEVAPVRISASGGSRAYGLTSPCFAPSILDLEPALFRVHNCRPCAGTFVPCSTLRHLRRKRKFELRRSSTFAK